ncbi:MAG TPA: phosphoribosylformylglycinamidine synthase subunit PurS [Saprospiraceae bacterium]|nr:phosphoribosylformylglycinamidine synthase subunit PurS [Saprospiraceae bacterium]
MQFKIHVNIMPHPELLDPQGKTVEANLPNVGIKGVSNVRIGKHIQFHMDAASEEEARQMASEACEKLLANPIMENYEIDVSPAG